MAHFTLLAKESKLKDTWKPCAIIAAPDKDNAGRQSKAMREGGVLAFVPSPAHFKIRRSTRSEISLMMGFFQSFGGLNLLFASDADKDGFFARRQRLLASFFMGIYIDPDSMKRRYGGFFTPHNPKPSSSTSSGGGSERPSEEQKEEAQSESLSLSQVEEKSEPVSIAPSMEVEDGGVDASNQESALAAILASEEANDGGKNRDDSFDLGMF